MAHATLSARREHLYQRLVVDGTSYTTAVKETANAFDTPRSTVETDISRLPRWVHNLDDDFRLHALPRLLELRRNRQHLHRLAEAAHDQADLETEFAVRRDIGRALVDELKLSARMGLFNPDDG